MKITKLIFGVSLLAASSVFADDIYMDTSAFNPGGSIYDLGTVSVDPDGPGPIPPVSVDIGTGDAGTATGIFEEFGFSALLATSIYDTSNGSIFGSFFDTNIPTELTAAGIPAGPVGTGPGLAEDGVTPLTLWQPNDSPTAASPAETDIDALNPLVPPTGSDNEGYLNTWYLDTEFKLEGTLFAGGPVYTGGFIKFFVEDTVNSVRTLAMEASLTGSSLVGVGLILNFDVISALPGLFFVDNGSGTFLDLATTPRSFRLDTNVDPAVPLPSQLLDIGGGQVARQSNLDGSIKVAVPEPASIAVFALGLLALGGLARRRSV